jgi:hypothetical protein
MGDWLLAAYVCPKFTGTGSLMRHQLNGYALSVLAKLFYLEIPTIILTSECKFWAERFSLRVSRLNYIREAGYAYSTPQTASQQM